MFTACVDQSCQAVIASVVIDQNLLRTKGTAVLQNPYVNYPVIVAAVMKG